VAGEGAATGAELYVGHGTVWVNGDNGYIAMQVSGLEVLPRAGLTDSGSTLIPAIGNAYLFFSLISLALGIEEPPL
ncbi:hypothetical protein CWI66_16190, partial [Halomonas sp. 141]|uniref:hypothetical protein n=1 Tax=Halomonas sp. 141 TaxID=2056666 RepID=UPI000CBA645D